jgi:hypothetical protein
METDAAHVEEPDAGGVAVQVDKLHLLHGAELRIGAYHAVVDEPRRPECSQRSLQPTTDREIERGLSDALHDTRVVERDGGRLEQLDLDVVGEPRALVAQLRLAVGEPSHGEDLVHLLLAALAFRVGEHELRGHPTRVPGAEHGDCFVPREAFLEE